MDFWRLHIHFGAPNPKDVCLTLIDNDRRKRKNGACKPEIEMAFGRNKIFVNDIGQWP